MAFNSTIEKTYGGKIVRARNVMAQINTNVSDVINFLWNSTINRQQRTKGVITSLSGKNETYTNTCIASYLIAITRALLCTRYVYFHSTRTLQIFASSNLPQTRQKSSIYVQQNEFYFSPSKRITSVPRTFPSCSCSSDKTASGDQSAPLFCQ